MASIDNGFDFGIEASLFKTADKLRGNMEPSDYKHDTLGHIFLKHISDRFELKRQALLADGSPVKNVSNTDHAAPAIRMMAG